MGRDDIDAGGAGGTGGLSENRNCSIFHHLTLSINKTLFSGRNQYIWILTSTLFFRRNESFGIKGFFFVS